MNNLYRLLAVLVILASLVSCAANNGSPTAPVTTEPTKVRISATDLPVTAEPTKVRVSATDLPVTTEPTKVLISPTSTVLATPSALTPTIESGPPSLVGKIPGIEVKLLKEFQPYEHIDTYSLMEGMNNYFSITWVSDPNRANYTDHWLGGGSSAPTSVDEGGFAFYRIISTPLGLEEKVMDYLTKNGWPQGGGTASDQEGTSPVDHPTLIGEYSFPNGGKPELSFESETLYAFVLIDEDPKGHIGVTSYKGSDAEAFYSDPYADVISYLTDDTVLDLRVYQLPPVPNAEEVLIRGLEVAGYKMAGIGPYECPGRPAGVCK